MSKKYKNSPLTEAVAEFNFIPDKEWNSTVPGEFYTKIKGILPIVKQREDQIALALPTEEKPRERIQMDIVQLVQFWDERRSLLAQIGKDFLTINALKPYPTWEKFLPFIEEVFSAYCEIASPKGIKRANLRYINTIEVPQTSLAFSGNFELEMPVPKSLKFDVRFINTHMEFDLNEIDVLAQKITSVPSPDSGVKNLVLQIEVVMNRFNGLPVEKVHNWLEMNHEVITNTFESTVTDDLKKKFE